MGMGNEHVFSAAASLKHLDGLCARMRPALEERDSHPWHETDVPLNLPAGPIAHW